MAKRDWEQTWKDYTAAYQQTGINQKAWCLSQDPIIDPAAFSKAVKQFKAQSVVKPNASLVRQVIKEEIAKQVEDNKTIAKRMIETAAPIAAEKLQSHMDCDNPAISLKASESILDRSGVSAPKESITVNTQIMVPLISGVDPEAINKLLGR